ncbi:MAG: hypothetical protein WCJ87_06390 [Burkholderiales bacterium]
MTRPLQTMPTVALVLLGLCAHVVHAAEREGAAQRVAGPENRPDTRPLSPAQLNGIRVISRNVLAAKKSGAEDGADASQLAILRESLDQLITADLDSGSRAPITLQGQDSADQRQNIDRITRLRDNARADATAVAAQLRERAEVSAARVRALPDDATRSGGLPVGEQRARLFERWAQKLDAALADGNPDRAVELRALREQLRATRGRLSGAPLSRDTPTLQAMPSGLVPPGDDSAGKGQGR